MTEPTTAPQRSEAAPSARRTAAVIAATALVYALAGAVGLALARLHANVSPLWPASGVALAALLLCGRRAWPGIALGAFVVNVCTDLGWSAAALIALGNTLEALIGRRVVRMLRARAAALGPFARPSSFLLAAVVAPVVAAALGCVALVMATATPLAAAPALFVTWWLGDAMGLLLIAPLALALVDEWPGRRVPRAPQVVKAVLVIAVGALLCATLFRPDGSPSLHFLAFPLVLLATAWFGRCGALLAAAAIAGFAVVGTVDVGSIGAAGHERLLLVEVFLGALAITALYLGEFLPAVRSPLPTAVMLGGWALGGWLFAALEQSALRLDHQRFVQAVRDAELRITQRMSTYVDALRAGASLHAASRHVDRREWSDFASTLDMVQRYPGIHGIGVVRPVPAGELATFTTLQRADGAPDFAVHAMPGAPAPAIVAGDPEHIVVTFLEPSAVNHAAIGLDIGSETHRRAAALAARDTGEPRISDRVTLLQDGEHRPGFLLFVPHYANGSRPATVAERRRDLVAWIYAPFVTASFLEGVLGNHASDLGLRCHRGLEPGPDDLLYSTASSGRSGAPEVVDTLRLAGQTFTLSWHREAGFRATAQGANLLTGAALALLAMLTAGFIHGLQTLRQRAEAFAIARTRDLEETNQQLEQQIHERERAEAEARQARVAAEDASRAKSDFLATMSHEIRTPLNSVIGFTDLLAESPLGDEQRSWASCIQTASRALLSLINDVLDFSKIEAGRMEFERVPFSPVAVAESVLVMLRARAEERRLPLVLDVVSRPPRPVLGDPNRVLQVLLNLAGNAVKFTAQGEVRVRVSCAPIDEQTVRLRVEVRDTGIGIPADKLPTLFREFTQADASTTRRFGGTGLGLAISKRLVEGMGGAIGVASTPGTGSMFHFELPLALRPVAAGTSAATSAAGHGEPADARPRLLMRAEDAAGHAPIRILVAEDVPMNQVLVKAMLKRLGCRIDFADDGAKAVAMSAQSAYDLIVMDCQMPELDGLEATRHIRARERAGGGRRVPIIAVTANALEGDRARCLDAGMDDYLTKPIRSDELTRVLTAWVAR